MRGLQVSDTEEVDVLFTTNIIANLISQLTNPLHFTHPLFFHSLTGITTGTLPTFHPSRYKFKGS
jgi:hypothetical protein